MKWPLVLTLLVGALLILRIVFVWDQLPEQMASHYGVSGRPDGFMSKDGFFGFLILVAGGSVAALFVTPLLMLRILPKSLINIPNRDYWMADEKRWKAATGRMSGLLGWMGFLTALFIAIVVELVLQSNLTRTNLNNPAFLTCLGVYMVLMIAGSLWIQRAFRMPE